MKRNQWFRMLIVVALTCLFLVSLASLALAQGGEDNGSDGLGLSEALGRLANQNDDLDATTSVAALFDQYNTNGSAFLDQSEFNNFLEDQGITERGQFSMFDDNGNGTLSFNEFNTYVLGLIETGHLGQTGPFYPLNQTRTADTTAVQTSPTSVFNQYDEDGNGLLELQEFRTFLSDRGITDRNQFFLYNQNFDNALSPQEFSTFLDQEGIDLSGSTAATGLDQSGLFSQYDANSNQLLSQSEFSAFLADQGIADRGQFSAFDQDATLGLSSSEFNNYVQSITTTGRLSPFGQTNQLGGIGLGSNALFSQYDADTNQLLSENEFGTFLSDQGIGDSGQFGTFDTDATTGLGTGEFNTFLQDQGLLGTTLGGAAIGAGRLDVALYQPQELQAGQEAFTSDASGLGEDLFVIGPSPVIRASTLARLTFVENSTGAPVALVRDALIDDNGRVLYLVLEANVTGESEVSANWWAVPYNLFRVVPEPSDNNIIQNFVFVFTGSEQDILASEPIFPTDLIDAGLFIDPADLNLSQAETAGPLMRARAFIEDRYPLVGPSNQAVAIVTDMIINLINNRVLWATLLTERGTTAIPLSAIDFNEVESSFLTDARQQTINDAPPVALGEWSSPFERNFDSDVATYWQVQPFQAQFNETFDIGQ